MPTNPTWEDSEPVPTWEESQPENPEPALDYALKAPVESTGGLLKALSRGAEGADMGRRQIERENLKNEMAKARLERSWTDALQGLATGAGAATELVSGLEPGNLLERTANLPAQLAGSNLRVGRVVSPDQVSNFLFPTPEQVGTVSQGIRQGVSELGSGMTDFQNLAGLAAGIKYPELVGRQFQVQMASQVPAATQQLVEAVKSGEPAEIGKAAVQLAATGATPALIEKGIRDASTVREDTGQLHKAGNEPTPSQEVRGNDVEQTPPEQHQPVVEGEGPPSQQAVEFVGAKKTAPWPRALVSKQPAGDGWRITWFSEFGNEAEPRGHQDFHTRAEAIKEAKSLDFDPVEKAPPSSALPGESPAMAPAESSAKQAGAATPPAGPAKAQGASVVDPTQIGSETHEAPIGMGGAVPSEFEPSLGTPTSTKNAIVDLEREKRNLPPAIQAARRDFPGVWDRAMARIDQDPQYQTELINELRNKPRAVTDEENAVILQRQIDLQNEYAKATRDLAQAHDDGRTSAVDAEKLRVAQLSDQLLDIYNIGKKVGTESGRGLNSRKMLANEDFTLAQMMLDKRAAVGGRPLTEAEHADIAKLHQEIADKQKAYDDYVASSEQRVAAAEARAATAELLRKQSELPNPVIQAAERIVKSLDTRADAARARLRERMGRTSAGVDPTILVDLAEIGASHIAHVGLDFAKWSAEMVKDLGEWVRPHLDEAFEASKKAIDAIGATEAVKKVFRQGKDVTQEDIRKQAVASIKEKADKNDMDAVSYYVQKLARSFVQSGIVDREKLIDAVHEAIKTELPNFTRRDTMDAISGYGRFKLLTKDDISTKLRDLKGQMQQLGKLADMAEQQAPKKTGVERRTPSDEERRLIKQVEEAKRRGGFEVTDPETQLRTALQAIKTRLTNEISDLEHQIASKEKIVKEKRSVELDEEGKQLKKRRDELKKEFDEVFGSKEMTDQQRVEAWKKRTSKRIDELEDRIKRGDFAAKPKRELQLDSEAMKLKARAEEVKRKFQEGVQLDRLKNRPSLERGADWLTKLKRFQILSSPVSLAKLTAAAVARGVTTPVEHVIGTGFGKMLPGVAQRASRSAGLNRAAEVRSLTTGIRQGLKDSWDTFRKGRSDLDILYGTRHTQPWSALDFFGNVHGALKATTKRMEFERSFKDRMDVAASKGVDVSNELVQMKLGIEAYKDANRAIFQQDNLLSKFWSRGMRSLEEKSKATEQPSALGKGLSTTGRILFPIVKVPTNIVFETLRYALGTGEGTLRLARAYAKGIENLKPEEANQIFTAFKKGSLGTALLMLGYFNPNIAGGYYQPREKRPKTEPKYGSIRVFGLDVPSFLLHNPALEVVQIGSTIRRVSDARLKNGETRGLGEGIYSGAIGVGSEVPFVRETGNVLKAFSPDEKSKFWGELARSMISPQALQWAAQHYDTDAQGNPVKRTPRTVMQNIEMGIPGLRQNVPRNKEALVAF